MSWFKKLFKRKDLTSGMQSFNRFNKDITIKVITYETKRQMQQARAKYDGSSIKDHKRVLGFTIFSNNNPKFVSEIHVPKNASEKTLGHELLHCLKGTFHDE